MASIAVEPALIAAEASAQSYERYFRARRIQQQPTVRSSSRREAKTEREAKPKKVAAAKPVVSLNDPAEPLVAIVTIGKQRIEVFNSGGIVAQSRISTGKSGHATPTGVFSILQRNRYHESNIYSGAPMPYMQRLTWSGIALHEGVVPGYPASHGCIRLPAGFATELWGLGRIGMRVVVAPSETTAEPIQSARLPAPVMTPVAVNELPEPVRTASAASTTDSEQRLLDPFKLGVVRKFRAAANKIATENAVQPAFERAAAASAEANRASDELRRAEQAVVIASGDLDQRREAIARQQTADGDADTAKAIAAAEAQVEAASKALEAARRAEREASDAAFAAARGAREAEAAAEAAAAAQKISSSVTEPVTIFVSRKEGRVLVRQGFVPLQDEPIAIREPERPLGTHVFTAMATTDGGAALTWKVVTVPNNPPEPVKESDKGRKAKAAPSEPRVHLPPSTAAEALERFDLPEATRKLVSDRLWPGASLIISDYGVSGETGRGTDFIVLTK